MALIKCSECGQTISDKAAACIHCGAPLHTKPAGAQRVVPQPDKPQRSKHPIVSSIAVIALIAFVVFWLSSKDSSTDTNTAIEDAQSSTSSEGDVSAANLSPPPALQPPPIAAPTIVLPSDEANFVRIVAAAQKASSVAQNDMQRGGIKAKRDAGICSVLSSVQVQNWIGTVDRIGANGDGKGVLAVTIAPEVTVSTWNNALSDMDDNTLIPIGSALFERASSLHVGNRVVFSGSFFAKRQGGCIEESSLTLQGGIDSPEFVFRFSTIGAPGSNTNTNSSHHEANVDSDPTRGMPYYPPGSLAKPKPSFDCARAASPDEKTICANTGLSGLDVEMAAAYKASLNSSAGGMTLKKAQQQWLRKRRTCGNDAPCLYRVYGDRITELRRNTVMSAR